MSVPEEYMNSFSAVCFLVQTIIDRNNREIDPTLLSERKCLMEAPGHSAGINTIRPFLSHALSPPKGHLIRRSVGNSSRLTLRI